MRKILFLFNRSPFNYQVRNDLRQYQIYTALGKQFQAKILCFDDSIHNSLNQKVIILKKNNLLKILGFVTHLKSPRLIHYSSKTFERALNEVILTFNPDYIYVEQLLMMQYVIDKGFKSKIIFFNDESNLFIHSKRIRGNLYQKARNIGLRKLEMKACKQSDHIFTITKDEEQFLNSLKFNNVFTIPYGVRTDYFEDKWEMPSEKSLLYVGDYNHYPNRQAVKILSKDILPKLRGLNVKLRVVGRHTNRIKKYLKNGMEIYENVNDIRPYYWNSSIFAAPIFSGAGLRVKILEAASCGIPIVLTPVANLGINLIDNLEAYIQNSTSGIIEILKELIDSNLSKKTFSLRKRARERIVKNFDEEILQDSIKNTFNKIER